MDFETPELTISQAKKLVSYLCRAWEQVVTKQQELFFYDKIEHTSEHAIQSRIYFNSYKRELDILELSCVLLSRALMGTSSAHQRGAKK